ncbi:MAG: HD domain-containing protein [Candidatus Microsaccharimonas sp.]
MTQTPNPEQSSDEPVDVLAARQSEEDSLYAAYYKLLYTDIDEDTDSILKLIKREQDGEFDIKKSIEERIVGVIDSTIGYAGELYKYRENTTENTIATSYPEGDVRMTTVQDDGIRAPRGAFRTTYTKEYGIGGNSDYIDFDQITFVIRQPDDSDAAYQLKYDRPYPKITVSSAVQRDGKAKIRNLASAWRVDGATGQIPYQLRMQNMNPAILADLIALEQHLGAEYREAYSRIRTTKELERTMRKIGDVSMTQAERLDSGLQELSKSLPSFGSYLIRESHDTSIPVDADFARNPDDPSHHAEKWHQHGIVTHSREFARAIQETIPEHLKDWGVSEVVEKALSETIDGMERRELLTIASLLHDIGKFTARKFENGSHDKWHFDGHAEQSGQIVRSELREYLGENLNLTDAQIEYIARCTELHFELGEVRKAAKTSGEGYTMKFVDTPDFKEAAQEIIEKYPDYALEIGLMFIADGLSKSEISATGEADDEIENQRAELAAEIAKRGLNPDLINQALQMPVNMKVARAYLTQWSEEV